MRNVPCQTSPCRADPSARTGGPTYNWTGDREKLSDPVKRVPVHDCEKVTKNVRIEACEKERVRKDLVDCKVHGIMPVFGQFTRSPGAAAELG